MSSLHFAQVWVREGLVSPSVEFLGAGCVHLRLGEPWEAACSGCALPVWQWPSPCTEHRRQHVLLAHFYWECRASLQYDWIPSLGIWFLVLAESTKMDRALTMQRRAHWLMGWVRSAGVWQHLLRMLWKEGARLDKPPFRKRNCLVLVMSALIGFPACQTITAIPVELFIQVEKSDSFITCFSLKSL